MPLFKRTSTRDRHARKMAANTKSARRYAIRRHADGTARGAWKPPAYRGGS